MTVTNGVLSLKDIIQYEEQLLPFRHLHLKRKPKIGLVGQPGEGKSLSLGYISLNQFMLYGEPCWSNLPIKYTYKVSDDIARDYGLSGGEAVFTSNPIDKFKLIRMSGDYHDGLVVLDEINIEFADAMKSQSNVNFYLDQTEQQFRKDRNGFAYSTIDEMWVDPRIRSITDIFIICEDLALSPEGLASEAPEGVNIKWHIYPMTRMFNGKTWNESKTVYTCIFHAKPYWGIIDTYYKQATGQKYAVDVFAKENTPSGGGVNKMAVQEYSRWADLYRAIKELRDMKITRLTPDEMWKYLEQFYPGTDYRDLGRQLKAMGIKRAWGTRGDYLVDPFKLDEPINEKVLVMP
jgi:hypothetical protein